MSFILDALKKSETDRQRQASPGLIEVSPIAPRPRFPVWAIAIGILLGVNLLVLVVVLSRADRSASNPVKVLPATTSIGGSETPTVAPPAAAEALANAGKSGSTAFSPMDAPVYAPEIPVPPGPSKHQADAAASAAPQPQASAGLTAPSEPHLTRPTPAAEADETLPTLDDLIQSGQKGLPELHLDIHVYDANSAGRFVFINMRKYREGAALQEGPSIERITRGGVILNYQGSRFLLPRQ